MERCHFPAALQIAASTIWSSPYHIDGTQPAEHSEIRIKLFCSSLQTESDMSRVREEVEDYGCARLASRMLVRDFFCGLLIFGFFGNDILYSLMGQGTQGHVTCWHCCLGGNRNTDWLAGLPVACSQLFGALRHKAAKPSVVVWHRSNGTHHLHIGCCMQNGICREACHSMSSSTGRETSTPAFMLLPSKTHPFSSS